MANNYLVILPTYRTVSVIKAVQWASADAGSIVHKLTGETVRRYIQDNAWLYWAAVNCWLRLVGDMTDVVVVEACYGLIDHMGWRTAITWLASYADCYIRDNCSPDGRVKGLMSEPCQWAFWMATRGLDSKTILQIARFLKRFTVKVPSKNCKLHDEAIAKFDAEQRRLRMQIVPHLTSLMSNRSTERRVVHVARILIRQVLGDTPQSLTGGMPRIGRGAARNCARSPYAKYEYLYRHGVYRPSLPVQPFALDSQHHDCVPLKRRRANGKWVISTLERDDGHLGPWPQVACLGSVPKKVDAYRLIAKEDPLNMDLQLRVKDEMTSLIDRSKYCDQMPLHDQSRNSEMARIGALTGLWCTQDYSAASDTVTKALVQLLFPLSWYRLLMRCVPFGYIKTEDDAGPMYLNSLGTMGCGCTFVVETLVFWSIAAATWVVKVHDLYNYGYQDAIALLGALNRISVYGDDVIIPTWLHRYLAEVSTKLGFRINESKSFAEGPFRESCGSDWLCITEGDHRSVQCVTSLYWPRIPITGTIDSLLKGVHHDFRDGEDRTICGLEALITLQQRLYAVSPSAASFLSSVIRLYAPEMTCSSDVTSSTPDLASDFTSGIRAVFVGGHVGRKYRTLSTYKQRGIGDDILMLPDGYVLWTCLEQFITDHGAQDIPHLRWQQRIAHVAVERKAPPRMPDGDYSLSFIEALRFDLSMTGRSVSSDIEVWDGRCSRTLSEILGFGADPIDWSALTGDRKSVV